MNKTILVLTISATIMIVAPTISRAADGKSGFFVNANIGQSDLKGNGYSLDDSDTGYSINTGYRWAISPAFAFGVEGGYTDPGNFKLESVFAPEPPATMLVGKAKLDGVNLGVNAHWNLSDTWYLSGRAGLFSADVKIEYPASPVPMRASDRSNDLYAGVGVGYDFSERFGLGLNYDRYDVDMQGVNLDTGRLSMGGEFRF